MKEYYSKLYLQEGATEEEIKTAYKKLAKVFHPDKHQGENDFLEEFKLIQEAYDKLIDHLSKKTPAYTEATYKPKNAFDFSYEIISDLSKPIKTGFYLYTFDGATYVKELGSAYIKNKADGIFLVIKLIIENIALGTQIIKSEYFTLSNSQSQYYKISSEAQQGLFISNLKAPYEKELQPGIPTTLYLGFEVPKEGEYLLELWKGGIQGRVKIPVNRIKQLTENI
jgi:curved DNA-binding protein CbpA